MAVIAKQRYKLDIAPKGGWVIVYASQHDNGAREIEFEITNQGRAFSIPASINISVQGVKSNSGYFSHSCSYSGNIVKMALANDMTDVIGKAICVLKFTNSSQQKLATAKFILNVDSDSSSEGIIIDTEAEEIFNQMLDEIRAQAASVSADIAELQSMVGSPLVASTASAMTDHNKIYVYTGSQSGYTNGNWYYWNGSAWTSGGVYNSTAINIDSVPTAGSTNAVQSGGVKSVLDGLQAEIPTVDSIPTQGSSNAVSSGGVWDEIADLNEDLSKSDVLQKLLYDNVPDTVQNYTFTDGTVSKVEHKSGNVIKRSDVFTYGTSSITEVRTLDSGESLTIVTNLSTLETTVTYQGAIQYQKIYSINDAVQGAWVYSNGSYSNNGRTDRAGSKMLGYTPQIGDIIKVEDSLKRYKFTTGTGTNNYRTTSTDDLVVDQTAITTLKTILFVKVDNSDFTNDDLAFLNQNTHIYRQVV